MSIAMNTFQLAATNDTTTIPAPAGMILLVYRGSIAHGLLVPNSNPDSIDDIDLMGFAVGEKRHYFGLQEWGTRGTKEIWQEPYDCVWYEARKAVSLLLQGNPNILSTLWVDSEHVVSMAPEGRELWLNRHLFIGKHVYNSFAGYARAQMLKMESREPAELREYLGITYALKQRGKHPTDQGLPAELGDHTDCMDWSTEKLLSRYRHYIRKGENLGYLGDKRKQLVLKHQYDCKNAGHAIRLLKMCREFLETGSLQVHRYQDAQELLDIKTGKWPLEQVKELAEALFADIKMARDGSMLPEKPDSERAEKLLIGIVQSYLERAA